MSLLSACSSNVTIDAAEMAGPVATPSAQTYGYSGTTQQVTVPAGATTASVVVIGAAGGADTSFGSTNGTPGGKGAKISGTLTVTPGDVLTLCVGGVGGVNDSNKAFGRGGWSCDDPIGSGNACNGSFPGGDGGSSKGAKGTQWDGPGGGGASAILTSSGRPLVVAGAGGGGTRNGAGGDGGKDTGGNGRMSETQQTPAQGGSSGTSWSNKGQSAHKTFWNAAGLGSGGGGGGGGCHNGQGGLVPSENALDDGGTGAGGNSLVTALTDVTAGVGANAAAGSITITFNGTNAG